VNRPSGTTTRPTIRRGSKRSPKFVIWCRARGTASTTSTRSVDDAADVPERRGSLDERVDRLAQGVDGAVFTSNPASLSTFAAASECSLRSPSRTCFSALTRRAIA
jgi:hypothetical protein